MPRRERYTANWTEWRGIYQGSIVRTGTPDNDMATPSLIRPTPIWTPQKFKIVGEVRISQTAIEDDSQVAVKAILAMKEALEGYLFVTSAVAGWQQEFHIQESWDVISDYLILRAAGSGWFDVPSECHEEIIDVSPKEEPYSEEEDRLSQHTPQLDDPDR